MGKFSTELMRAGGVIASCQIINATVNSEYNSLSDNHKEIYKMIISCGVLDLTEGTSIRTKLWNMFDENSTTRANLIELLGE